MKRHYHVVTSVPGYMPESDPYVCATLKEAISCAKGEKDDFLDMGADAEIEEQKIRAYGSARNIDKRGGTIYTIDNGWLGWVIDIMPCTEDRPECTGEE